MGLRKVTAKALQKCSTPSSCRARLHVHYAAQQYIISITLAFCHALIKLYSQEYRHMIRRLHRIQQWGSSQGCNQKSGSTVPFALLHVIQHYCVHPKMLWRRNKQTSCLLYLTALGPHSCYHGFLIELAALQPPLASGQFLVNILFNKPTG